MIKKITILIAIGILALALRWYASVSLPIDYDEPTYYKAASAYATAIRLGQPGQILEYSFNYEHPILAKLVYGAALAVLPPDNLPPPGDKLPFKAIRPLDKTRPLLQVLWLRKISVGFGTLQVILLGLISPLAALLLAIDSMTVKYTSVIYVEALPALASTASVILFSKALAVFQSRDEFSWRAHRREGLWLILSAACLGIAVAAKYQYAVVGVAIVLFGLFLMLKNRLITFSRIGLLFAWGLLAVAVFFLADPYLWPAPITRLAQSLGYSVQYTQGEDVQQAAYPMYQPFLWLAKSAPAQPSQAVPADGKSFPFQLDTLIALLAIVGLPRLAKVNPLFLVWLVVGLIFLLLWNTKWPQYVLTITAPLCYSAAEGILTLTQPILPRLLKIAGVSSILLFLSACSIQTGLNPANSEAIPTRPLAQILNPVLLTLAQLRPQVWSAPVRAGFPAQNSAACLDNLNYLEDLNIPDRTPVSPGQALEKRWLVENTGSCNWDDQYRLRLISGQSLGAALEQPLYPASRGTQSVLGIRFTAPAEPGDYRSTWQAYNPQGKPFGDPVFIEIIIPVGTQS